MHEHHNAAAASGWLLTFLEDVSSEGSAALGGLPAQAGQRAAQLRRDLLRGQLYSASHHLLQEGDRDLYKGPRCLQKPGSQHPATAGMTLWALSRLQ